MYILFLYDLESVVKPGGDDQLLNMPIFKQL